MEPRREPITIRFFITEELNEKLTEKYGRDYPAKNSDGVKADLYRQFDVKPPSPPTALDKKIERLRKLEAEVEALRNAEKKKNAEASQTPPAVATPAAQNDTAKPSEQNADADKATPANRTQQNRTPAKSGAAQKK